jgi:hypothetical protein
MANVRLWHKADITTVVIHVCFRGAKRTAVLERLARSNAAHWGTHIRRRNRKRSDDAVAVPRSFVAAIRALAT